MLEIDFTQHLLQQAHHPAYSGSWKSRSRLSTPFEVENRGRLSFW